MTEQRVVVTGATGMLGATLVRQWAPNWHVTALSQSRRVTTAGVVSHQLDLSSPTAVDELIAGVAPDVIVHCAAWTDLDGCERDPTRATRLHRDATDVLARAASRAGASFVYISTDSIFGEGAETHTEDEPPVPLSIYAKTKLEGERAAAAAGPALIVRTCIVGWGTGERPTLFEWILTKLRAGEVVTGFTDVRFTPLSCNALCSALEGLLARSVRGVINVAGSECLSKYVFARKIAEVFDLPLDLVAPSSIDGAKLLAPRPRCTCLDTSKYTALTHASLPDADECIRSLRELERQGWDAALRASVSAT